MRLFTPIALLPVVCSAAIIGFCQMNAGEKRDSAAALKEQQPISANALIRYNLAPEFDPAELQPGGVTTFHSNSSRAYNSPSAHLSSKQRLDYFAGHSFFKNPWVSAPASTTARDGLGPVFNSNTCKGCHIRNGRSSVNETGLLVRVSQMPQTSMSKTALPSALYGGQLQPHSVRGLDAEANYHIEWEETQVNMGDGTAVTLKSPTVVVDRWGYGEPETDLSLSLRIAPPMIGLGLLDAIAQSDIEAEAKRQLEAGYVAGRVSRVINRRTGETQIGRFGWKALQPTVEQQSAGAFHQDLGLQSRLYPESVCTQSQIDCLRMPEGNEEGHPEVRDVALELVTYYASLAAVPAPRNALTESYQDGREVFYQAGCAQCHKPSWKTQAAPKLFLEEQTIWPYTDLLLHDMGPGLAAPAGEENTPGHYWRTAPLWGIGLAKKVNPVTGYLHDGRAATLEEAILWHGGEAESSKVFFVQLPKTKRQALLNFLENL